MVTEREHLECTESWPPRRLSILITQEHARCLDRMGIPDRDKSFETLASWGERIYRAWVCGATVVLVHADGHHRTVPVWCDVLPSTHAEQLDVAIAPRNAECLNDMIEQFEISLTEANRRLAVWGMLVYRALQRDAHFLIIDSHGIDNLRREGA